MFSCHHLFVFDVHLATNQVINYCFQALQSALVARQVHDRQASALEALQRNHSGCAGKIKILNDLAESRYQAHAALQKEFDDFASRVQVMQAEMHAEAQKSITQQVMKARVETMLDFQRGDSSVDDIPDTVRIYNEAYPDDAFPVDDLGVDDNAVESPKGDAPDDDQA